MLLYNKFYVFLMFGVTDNSGALFFLTRYLYVHILIL